jgi:hypothetical protein
MKSALDKQATHLANIDKTLQQDKLIQLTQVVLQAKTDSDLNKDQEEANAHLNEIQKSSKETASNVIYLFKEFKKYSEEFEKQAKIKEDNTVDKALKLKLSPEKRSLWSGTEKEKKQFGTAKGFLRQTGLISEGGFIDNMLQRREDKQQLIQDSMKRDPQMVNLKQFQGKDGKKKLEKSIGKKFDETESTVRKLQNNKDEFERLEAQGWDSTDPKNAKLFKPLAEERSSLSSSLEKNDKRFRPTAEKSTEKAIAGKTTAEKANSNDPISFSDEGQLEQQRSQEKSVAILEKIEENTRKLKGSDGAPVKVIDDGGGLLDSIMSFIGPGFMKLIKAIFNPKNLLKAFTKVFVPAMIIGSIVNGIVDAFKTFFNGGSFLDVMIAGLGGVLSFLTFGLIDGKTIKKIADFMGGFIDEYVITPIKDFVSYIGESFNKYIAEPLATVFEPITNFFKQIKEQVFGFLEDFGIPEIGFTIPIINKKVSIGPFYPFRPGEGENRVAANESIDQSSSSAGGEKSNFNQNIVTSGKTEYSKEYMDKETPEQKARRERLSKDTTDVLSKGEKVVNGKATYTENLASFDPKTGKAMLSGDAAGADGEREISKRAFSKIKSNAKSGGSAERVAEIVKEDDAYQKLGFFDKLKVDTGFAKATDLVKVEKPSVSTGNAVYDQSSKNTEMSMKPAQTQTPIVVSAPTTNNTTKQSIAMPAPVRNQDSEFGRYVSRRALIV